MVSGQVPEIVAALDTHVKYLRRYARALTGSQSTGDRYALAALEAVMAEPSILTQKSGAKVGLFGALHAFWGSSGAPLGEPDNALSARAQQHMSRLTPFTREAILLHSIEGFSHSEIGEIMDVSADEAARLISIARREMHNAIAGRVLVIEDEAIIALDLVSIVEEVGHSVTGVARTEAVALARKSRPDLILADIQLADKSSGIDAVNEIMTHFAQIPVIFITAFPERLLTGAKPEPAFLIPKPFSDDQVRLAISQALFFASTETLAG